MIFRGSSLRVLDDSGVAAVKCVQVLKKKKFGSLGNFVRVSIRKRFYNISLLKRTLCFAFLVGVRRKKRRLNGFCIVGFQNSVFLLNDSQTGFLLNDSLKYVDLLPAEVFFFSGLNLKLLVKGEV